MGHMVQFVSAKRIHDLTRKIVPCINKCEIQFYKSPFILMLCIIFVYLITEEKLSVIFLIDLGQRWCCGLYRRD